MINLNEEIIKVGLRICKRNEGALIVVGNCEYTPLVEQEVKPFDITKNIKLLESLALMDGAVIIGRNGFLKAYGVKIKSNLTWKNFGTKHSAGYSASINEGNTVYIVSQEDVKIRIFQKGKLIMEIDGRQKDIEKKISEISKIMESVGWGTLGTVGMGLLAPAFGIVITSGITLFVVTTGISYTIKKLQDWKIIK